MTGRRKFRQILEAFSDEPMDKEHPKYLCAPCSNCKGQIRDIINYYDAWEKAGIYYGGLVELIVNCHGRRRTRLHRLGMALIEF